MKQFEIADKKALADHLFAKESFDTFLLREASFVTLIPIHLDGTPNPEYDDLTDSEQAALPPYVQWRRIRPLAFQLIKGKKLPKSFKIVFRLSPSHTEAWLKRAGLESMANDVDGLFLMIRFEGGHMYASTGTSLKTFSLDRTMDQAWDAQIASFFKQLEIPLES